METSTNSNSGERETRFSRRREKTRRELLLAARRVFGRKGLAEAIIKDITDEADVGFGTFYLHFASKEDIFNETLRDGLDELRRAVELVPGADPFEQQKAAVLAYFNFAYHNRDLFQLIFWSQLQLTGEVRRLRADMRDRVAGNLAGLIEQGLIKWPDPQLLGNILVGIMAQAGLWWVDHDQPSPEEMTELIINFLQRGFFGELPPFLNR